MMADVSDVSGIGESRFNGSEDDVINVSIFDTIKQIRNNNNRADVPAIFSVMTKSKEFENLTPNFIEERINTLIVDEMILNKQRSGKDSYYVNEQTSVDIPNIPELQDTPMLLKNMTRSNVFTCTENEGDYINNNNINNNQVLHEMQAMKSFFMDELYEVKSKIKSINLLNEIEEKGKNDNRLIQELLSDIEYLRGEINTKIFIIKTLLEDMKSLKRDDNKSLSYDENLISSEKKKYFKNPR